jgi:hypothetical protein
MMYFIEIKLVGIIIFDKGAKPRCTYSLFSVVLRSQVENSGSRLFGEKSERAEYCSHPSTKRWSRPPDNFLETGCELKDLMDLNFTKWILCLILGIVMK